MMLQDLVRLRRIEADLAAKNLRRAVANYRRILTLHQRGRLCKLTLLTAARRVHEAAIFAAHAADKFLDLREVQLNFRFDQR